MTYLMDFMNRLSVSIMLLLTNGVHAQDIRSFTPTILYSGVGTPGGATFQSQNHLVTRTSRGCYFTAIHDMLGTTYEQNEIAALWFAPTCEAPYTLLGNYGPYNGGAPAVVSDPAGNVYWLVSNDQTNNLYIAKYGCGPSPSCIDLLASTNLANTSSTKWTAMYSECFGQGALFVLSFFPVMNFSIINPNLSVYDHYQLTQAGPISGLEYPRLERSCPYIAAAWVTTAVTATSPSYDGIHYMLNNFNGHRDTWTSPTDGANLPVPVVADDTGPTPEMRAGFTPPPPLNSVWFGAFALTHQTTSHVAYASPNGPAPTTETEQAWRSNMGTWGRTALHDNLMQGASTSKVGGAMLTIQERRGSSSCYFKGGDGALYFMGPSKEADANGNNWIDIIKSTDDGVTWADFAQSATTFNIYALNCMPEGTELPGGGWANGDQIVGIFTHIMTPGSNFPQQVYTFHLSIN